MKSMRSIFLRVIVLCVLWGLMGCNVATVQPEPVSTEAPTVATTAVPPTPTIEPTPMPTATATATEIPTAEPIPGIEAPVEIFGVDLLFTSLEQVDAFPMIIDGKEFITHSEEGLMGYLLTAESSNGTMETIKKWPNNGNKLVLTLSNGEELMRALYLGNLNEAEVEGIARWILDVPIGTTVKTVQFPDGTVIDLSPLYD